MDDTPVIYGLEDFQARTLVSQAAESEKIRFLVGTQSIKNINQVQLIEFDDDTGQITKYPFLHDAGEIWALASAPQSSDLIATVYYDIQNFHTNCGAAIWKLPIEPAVQSNSHSGIIAVEKMCNLVDTDCKEKYFKVYSVCWAPEDDSRVISLIDNRILYWDVQAAGKDAKISGQITVEGRSSSHLGKVRWCPHQQATNVAVTYGSNIVSYDLRSMKQSWVIENTHLPILRDFDFNPNRQYFLATCGDDGGTKIWDVRNASSPVLQRFDHSHWVWSVRFNASYDQLVLSCSSDQRVILSNLPSVASQPLGSLTDEEEKKKDKQLITVCGVKGCLWKILRMALKKCVFVFLEKNYKMVLNAVSRNFDDVIIIGIYLTEDCVLHTYEDHEESVYAVEWSSADFWTFASISFDGRLVINKVPKSFKYKQFM